LKLITGIILVALVIAVVSLGMTTLAFSKRAADATAQLDRARIDLQELRGRGRRVPMTWEDSLREFAGQQEVPYPQFRGFDGPPMRPRLEDGRRYGMMTEQRERRRQAIELWFQQTIAALDERARTATAKEVADVAAQLSATLFKLNALRPRWDEVRQMSDETRREGAQRLYVETSAVLATLLELSARDRQLRLADFARSLGQTDEMAIEAFVAGVIGVYGESHYNPGRSLTNANVNSPVP
jgi:hypothetical protein